MLTYPRKDYNETDIKKELVLELIKKHSKDVVRLTKLKNYYLGKHNILNKVRNPDLPNYKTVCNHAKDIADTATGYFMGNSINYTNTKDADIENLLIAFDDANTDEIDHDNALDMAIYGVAYEYIYAKENSNELDIKSLEPENTFIVYDDSIEQQALFAVYYYKYKDIKDNELYRAVIMTENYIYNINLKDKDKGIINDTPILHNMGMIPVIEYCNNKFKIGDYEQQIELIDAYNSLTGNRVNDKEQAVNSILVIYGARLGDTTKEEIEAAKVLKELGILNLPNDAKAEYLHNTLDENAVEVLRRAIKEDIYTFSHVPNLSDENFAGNSSGVAMEFKLLGLEMITKTKQRYYVKGLRQRIKIFANYLGLQQILVDANSIEPQFSRSLPKNMLELSQVVNNLDGKVSQKTLISQLPFVVDPESEIDEVAKQKEENILQQQQMFEIQSNEKLVDDYEEE